MKTTTSGGYRFTYSLWRNIGHLRDALVDIGWNLDTLRYMFDRDRLHHGEDIHPLEWQRSETWD